MVSVGCFPVASADYRVERAVPSAKWPIPYMPCGHFSEKSAPRGVPGVICTTHIVARWGCGGGEAGPFLPMTVVSFLPYSPECVEGPFLGQLELPPTPGLEVRRFGHGERRRKAREKVAMVLAIGHALRAHEALGCPDALSGFLEVVHRLFENGVFVGHDQSIRPGRLSFVVSRPKTFGGGDTTRSAKRRVGRQRWQMRRPWA
jgi:hypothetical protein